VGQVMKDKNCVDPRMASYCQAVRDLEGKFHGLKLHHVLRDYNKAANVLEKAASSRSRFHTVSSRAINISHPSEKRARSHPKSRGPRSWQSTSHQK
jgi:ribosomal protein S2